MKLKNNSINYERTSRFKSSRICLGLALLFSLGSIAQVELRESLESEADRIVIDLGVIDHLELSNSMDTSIRIRVVNSKGVPRTEHRDNGKTLHITSVFTDQIELEPLAADKLCSVEPVYPSFRVMIPADKDVFVSIDQGNLYAEGFHGDLKLLMEEGLVRLKGMQGEVKVEMHRGRLWFVGLDDRKVHAETNMGELVLTRRDGSKEVMDKNLEEEFGTPQNLVDVRSVMGSIYLEH